MYGIAWNIVVQIAGKSSFEAAKKLAPKLTKEIFKKIKNSKKVKNELSKKKVKKIKTKKKDVKKDTKPKKKDTKPKKKDTKPKKKDTKPKDTKPADTTPKDVQGPPPPTWWRKEAGMYRGMWNMLPAGLRNQISKAGPIAWKGLMLDFKPFSAIKGPVSRKIVKGVTQFGLGYGGLKAYDVIKGEGGMVTGGDNINIKTGDVDTQTDKALDTPTSGIAGTDDTGAHMNAFINAHNTALNSGQAEFTYAGRTYTVGTVPMQNF